MTGNEPAFTFKNQKGKIRMESSMNSFVFLRKLGGVKDDIVTH